MADVAEGRTIAHETGDAAPAKRGVPRWAITVASVIVLLLLWEYFGRDINPIFGSYPSAIFSSSSPAMASSARRCCRACSRSCSAMASPSSSAFRLAW